MKIVGTPLTIGTFLIHTVFSTRNQEPLITPAIGPYLYDKISKILFDECYSPAIIIGGDVEHVHILYVDARDRSTDFIVDRVKKRSAEFIRKWCPPFDWQQSYAAVSVSRSSDEIEKDLIARQKTIHKELSYKDEFRKFLDDNGIEYDEEGLWE
ncbi:MAG: transposase [Pyrinomonadaceae bacterium]